MGKAYHYQHTFRDQLARDFTSVLSILDDPTEVPGLVVWHGGDDLSSITVVNDQVTIWDDKSGNNHHLGPVAGETLPSISSDLQNGRTGIFFDYTEREMLENDYMASGTGSLQALWLPSAWMTAPHMVAARFINPS